MQPRKNHSGRQAAREAASSPRPIRVLLASRETAERLGLATIIAAQPDMEVVAQAARVDETADLLERHAPHVAVIDAGLLEEAVLTEIRRLARRQPPMRLLVLVMHAEGEGQRRALQAHAHGMLLRGMEYRDLVQAIRTLHRGDLYSPEMVVTRDHEPD